MDGEAHCLVDVTVGTVSESQDELLWPHLDVGKVSKKERAIDAAKFR